MRARSRPRGQRGGPFVALAAVLAVGTIAGSAVSAQGRPPGRAAQGRASLTRGSAAYDVGDYETALRAFQEAYIELRDPTILLNVGAASERLGRRDEARRAFQQYLDRTPNAPDRAQVEARIAALAGPAPSAPPAPTPSAAPALAPAPSAEPVAQPAGPPRVEPPPAHAPEPTRVVRPWWPWVVAGGGALVAGAGVALVATAAPPNPNQPTEQNYLAERERFTTLRASGYALVGVGGAVAVAGVVLAVALPGRREVAPIAWVSPGNFYYAGVRLAGF